MKKKLTKLLAVSMAVLSLGTFVGCGKKPATPNTETDIEIYLWKSGIGDEFMKDIVAGFEAKYPQYDVHLDAKSDGSYVDTTLKLGADLNSVDLYFVSKGHDYEQYCEPLNDVLEYTNEGESKTIAEKIGDSRLRYFKSKDNNYYSLSYYGGWGSLVYNADVIDGTKYKVPKTTDELYYLAMDLASEKKTPFIHFTDGGYWYYLYDVWTAQYAGLDKYLDTFENPTLEKVCDDSLGVKQMLEVMEQLIGATDQCYNGSNSYDFTSAQTLFLENKAVMMANGSWMEYEMRENYEEGTKNYSMMRVPVISSIIDNCPSIEDDAELSALVDAIDAGNTALEGTNYAVSQADYDRVKEARSLMTNNFDAHTACIPNYSTAKEGAKKFLQYFYSNEALVKYANAMHAQAPVDMCDGVTVDASSWSKWAQEQNAFNQTQSVFISGALNEHKIFGAGGCSLYGVYTKTLVKFISSNNPNDKVSATKLWGQIKTHHTTSWDTYFQNAGLSQ